MAYYKKFSAILAPRLLPLFNALLTDGHFTPESLSASIVLIPKPDRDPLLPESYRPISLLNTDVKIFAKLLSNRLDLLLPRLIHPDQVGFIPGRQAFDNTRRAIDLLWHASSSHTPSLFLSLDAEKAFDRVEWPYLFLVLEHFGFPEKFIAAVRSLYASPTASIVLPHAPPTPFQICNGTRQGCPLSPALFALILEPLLQAIRQSDGVRGLRVGDQTYTVSAYADDILLSLTDPTGSLESVSSLLARFSNLSGYKINMSKSEALAISVTETESARLATEHRFRIQRSRLKYLGIYLTTRTETLYGANYTPLLRTLQQDLDRWSRHMISWLGRIHCVKMNLLPRMLYLFQTLPIPLVGEDLQRMQRHIDDFVWGGGRRRIGRQTLYRPRDRGGLGLPCLRSYYYASQLAQIVAWHCPTTERRWVELEHSMALPLKLDLWIWLSRPHRPLLRTACPAITNSLTIWTKIALKCDLTCYPSPLTPLCHNREFAPGLQSAIFSSLTAKGLHRICHLFPRGTLLQYQDLQEGAHLPPASLFRFLQLRDFALRPHIKQAALTKLTPFESTCLRGRYTKGLISSLYQQITCTLDWAELPYIRAWHADLQEQLEGDSWLDIWEASRKISVCTTIQEQAVKLLMRWYTTPAQLARIKKTPTGDCWRQCGAKGTYFHMWWTCPVIHEYWSTIQTLFEEVMSPDSTDTGPLPAGKPAGRPFTEGTQVAYQTPGSCAQGSGGGMDKNGGPVDRTGTQPYQRLLPDGKTDGDCTPHYGLFL
uniref:Reverse transcriptase domain-containing protein n=1 Tax=Leptobrachium leishanense TaxID=445787 RepID=A0A8C5PNC3_9ANUR